MHRVAVEIDSPTIQRFQNLGKSAAGTDTNPAWDFQLIVPKPIKGNEYQLRGRLVYKRWQGCEDVLAEVSKCMNSWDPP